jgi:hypothetical protein
MWPGGLGSIKMYLKEIDGGLDLCFLRYDPVAGPCEYSNKHIGSIKVRHFSTSSSRRTLPHGVTGNREM